MSVTVSVDPLVFQEEVLRLFRGSPVAADFPDGKLVIKNFEFVKLVDVVRHACSSVEIVKANIVTDAYPDGVPPGVKFSPSMCVNAAVNLVFSVVSFGGPWGWLISMFGKQIIIALIEAVLTGFKGKDWLYSAKQQLRLAA